MKPHHTHACQFCGATWRPAVVNTIGVRFLPGFQNVRRETNEELLKGVLRGDASMNELRERVGWPKIEDGIR